MHILDLIILNINNGESLGFAKDFGDNVLQPSVTVGWNSYSQFDYCSPPNICGISQKTEKGRTSWHGALPRRSPTSSSSSFQAGLCLFGESSWRVPHIWGSSMVSELPVEPLSFVLSCCIEKASFVNSMILTFLTAHFFSCSSFSFNSFILFSRSLISCSMLALSSSISFL